MMFSLQLHSSFVIVLPGLAGGTLTGEAATYSVSQEKKKGKEGTVLSKSLPSVDTSSLELC